MSASVRTCPAGLVTVDDKRKTIGDWSPIVDWEFFTVADTGRAFEPPAQKRDVAHAGHALTREVGSARALVPGRRVENDASASTLG
jgi:hypothetical protein